MEVSGVDMQLLEGLVPKKQAFIREQIKQTFTNEPAHEIMVLVA